MDFLQKVHVIPFVLFGIGFWWIWRQKDLESKDNPDPAAQNDSMALR